MSSINYIRAANEIAKLYVAQGNGMIQLSDKLLHALREAEDNKADINMIWASIARTNGWSDRDAGLEGNPMPKTLANYRSLSRKALELGVGHQFSDHASWKKAIAQAVKLSKVEPESAPIPSIDLNEIELPSYVEHIIKKRSGMSEKNIKAFDTVIIRAIEKFMEVA